MRDSFQQLVIDFNSNRTEYQHCAKSEWFSVNCWPLQLAASTKYHSCRFQTTNRRRQACCFTPPKIKTHRSAQQAFLYTKKRYAKSAIALNKNSLIALTKQPTSIMKYAKICIRNILAHCNLQWGIKVKSKPKTRERNNLYCNLVQKFTTSHKWVAYSRNV